MTDLTKLALDCGFSCAAPLSAGILEFRDDVRDMCRADRCGSYGKNWCCPPACPSLEEMQQRMRQYDKGVLVQTVVQMDGDFDYEAMMEGEKRHKQQLETLAEQLKAHFGADSVLPMGAGTCRRCPQCTYPHAPCRFPEKQIVSMEAYGLLVSQVCGSCGVDYYHGPGTLSYVSCVFLRNGLGENTWQ